MLYAVGEQWSREGNKKTVKVTVKRSIRNTSSLEFHLHFSLSLPLCSQTTQQMSGLAVSSGAAATFTQSGPPAGGWATPAPAPSGQTLSTQLWK